MIVFDMTILTAAILKVSRYIYLVTGQKPPIQEPWRAVHPDEAVLWLAGVRAPWWVAGGWALDLFLGRQSRSHHDFDVGILRRDVLEVIAQLSSWEFFESKDGLLVPLLSTPPRCAVNSLWGRPRGGTHWLLELMLDESDRDAWVFRRDQRIRVSLKTAIRHTSRGVPYLAPELQLLYKSRVIRPQDQADFECAAPLLGTPARAWLRESLRTIDPNHRWLAQLNSR
jgi:hypothetical protein